MDAMYFEIYYLVNQERFDFNSDMICTVRLNGSETWPTEKIDYTAGETNDARMVL